MKEFVELKDQKLEQGIRDEHAVESKVGAREHEIIHGEVPDESKVETR